MACEHRVKETSYETFRFCSFPAMNSLGKLNEKVSTLFLNVPKRQNLFEQKKI